ncbi:hypothetical protein AVEN_253543-1 [Araneus ventricosus]|uniref:Uncharacterized protein n=1 Tax=Araneus ventricosus TaxID=182803 RepID=A0A4Y2BUF4_ARAVE|nr:hypothetical protein AVEN_253543-1 [Araneus ventricosus]
MARGLGQLNGSKERCEVNNVNSPGARYALPSTYTHSTDREPFSFRARGYTVSIMPFQIYRALTTSQTNIETQPALPNPLFHNSEQEVFEASLMNLRYMEGILRMTMRRQIVGHHKKEYYNEEDFHLARKPSDVAMATIVPGNGVEPL